MTTATKSVPGRGVRSKVIQRQRAKMLRSVSRHIKEFRKRDACSFREVAEAIGSTAPSVHAWEQATRLPGTEFVPALARLCGVSTDELLGVN